MAGKENLNNPRRKVKLDRSTLHEMIEKKAYEIYEKRGKEHGKALDDWVEAEMEVKNNMVCDPKTMENISGEVISIERITLIKKMFHGVHMTVKTDNEIISVHLGPGWYIDRQDIKIEPKGKVEVKGSRINCEGRTSIIATEVKRGKEFLRLCNENGFPVWVGAKKHKFVRPSD
ncbi:MAG TPA: DUF2934 domain-containing protein [Thermodesulfobacteriota bacterium]